MHGFGKGRGTNTAMLEVWEYVLKKTEKGDLVALDFLDVSAGFDTLVHLYILRKMEVQYGMEKESLEWLSSYLEGWVQYTVVDATCSSTRRMKPKGAPQGGGLSPILWRSSTNDIPEAGLVSQEEAEGIPAATSTEDSGVISKKVDNKEEAEMTTEEKLDRKLRREGAWKLDTWRKERTGEEDRKDCLKQKRREDQSDVVTTIFADDTQSRASAKTKAELERRNSEGLTKICSQLKAMRLKVNEGKTTYMVLASMGRRKLEDLNSEITICGEVVKNVKVGKSLGLLVSDDLTWRHQTEKVVKSCREKLTGLWKCTEVLNKHKRKTKAEAIIMSRLNYCLEVVSTGRKKDMEKLQGVQSAAARWVAQTRSRDWHIKSGLKKLGWLSMCQQAAYSSLKTAMKVLRQKNPERLYETLTEEVRGERKRKMLDEKKVIKMKNSTKKAWSIRSLRWMAQMPEELIGKDVTLKSTKKELKEWIRRSIPVKGDRILWGEKLTGEMMRKTRRGPRDPEDDGNGQEKAAGEEQDEDLGEACRDKDVEVQHEEDKADEIEDDSQVKESSIQQERIKMWLMKKMKHHRKGKEKLEEERPGRRMAPGKGGWMPENLPRAGAEPPNPGKRGSLSSRAAGGNLSGETFLLWCPHPLTPSSCMVTSLREKVQQSRRTSKLKNMEDLETGEKSGRKRDAWHRSGVG